MLVLINSLILLAMVGLALGGLFWKHFAKRPKESIRATWATIIGTIAMTLFLLQVGIMTTLPGQNLITIIIDWLTHL